MELLPFDAISILLKENGFRDTPIRREVIATLTKEYLPISIEEVQEKIPGADPVTLYRALEAFVSAGIVDRFKFDQGPAQYELSDARAHHHHIVCTDCGKVADVPASASEQLDQKALQSSKEFSRVNRHSLEFYGTCVTCA